MGSDPVNGGSMNGGSTNGGSTNGGAVCGCEVCGDASANCTVMTDDGELELCAGCAEVVGDSEGWRPSALSDVPEPSDDSRPSDESDPSASTALTTG